MTLDGSVVVLLKHLSWFVWQLSKNVRAKARLLSGSVFCTVGRKWMVAAAGSSEAQLAAVLI
jgi:hypothetical protein